MFDLDYDTILETFTACAAEHLDRIEEQLVTLEQTPDDADLIRDAFAAAHSLKGDASLMGMDRIADLAHSMEDALESFAQAASAVTPEAITLVLRATDVLRSLCETPDESTATEKELELRAALTRLAKGESLDGAVVDVVSNDDDHDDHDEQAAHSAGRPRNLRVDIRRLDKMLDLTGEAAIAYGRLVRLLEDLDHPSRDALLEACTDVERHQSQLQELVMMARLVPVEALFRRYSVTIRELSSTSGKDVRLVVEAGDVEVDTSVVENLRDPLTHIVRNAVAHGLEDGDVRKAAGKPAMGTITLRAYHDAGNVVIEVADDGAGIDRAKVQARAEALGWVEPGARLEDHEIFSFLFVPGFSTAGSTTDLSGRGVGLDVVRANVQALRGTVAIHSRPHIGTTITLRLPVTMAIIDGFAVGVGEETYIIPLDSVVECRALPAEERSHARSAGVVYARGQMIPYVRLRHAFGIDGAGSLRESVVLVQYQRGIAALAVDSLLGEKQTVIKPLGNLQQEVPGVSGSAILGNGRVALILDINSLFAHIDIDELGALSA